jgi:tetratricopeptide (TPR) repeat protein
MARNSKHTHLPRSPSSVAGDQTSAKLRKAVALHQKGQLAGAKALYENILRTRPKHPDALHLLGVIALQTNDFQRSADLIRKAIKLHAKNAMYFYNYGNALNGLRQFSAAVESYDRAIAITPDYAEAYSNRGIVLQALGRFEAAIESYDRAIAVNPKFAEAYSNRGNALMELERFDPAFESYDSAIALKPDYAEAYANRGNAFKRLQNYDAAAEGYHRAIAINPGYAEAYHNLGVLLQEQKQFAASLENFDKSIALSPDHAGVHFNHGNALMGLGRFEDAARSFDRAIAIQPDYVEAHSNRGNALSEIDHFDEAIASYNQAIALKQDFAEAHFNRGNALRGADRLEAAIESYARAIAIKPDYAEALYNQGNARAMLMHFDAAIEAYDRAISLKPDYEEAYANRGNALMDLGQYDAALTSYDQALAIKPNYAEANWNKSLLLLLDGNFIDGWELHEWRWNLENFPSPKRDFTQPLWLGDEPLAGKSILLHAEQGLGDAIHFCRYAKLVSALGAKVFLETSKPLASILQRLEGVDEIFVAGETLPQFDYHCPLLSLALAFRTNLKSIPSGEKYLSTDTSKLTKWKDRLGERKAHRVGLVWSGSTIHKNDKNRSIPLADFMSYLDPDYQYVSLQKELRDSDKAALEANGNILHLGEEIDDFEDTAALCELMDVVVSVDTSVAHLSGALGKKTWVLLPFNPDWRWLRDRTDSPWYPSVKLYRQHGIGDWSQALGDMKSDLANIQI